MRPQSWDFSVTGVGGTCPVWSCPVCGSVTTKLFSAERLVQHASWDNAPHPSRCRRPLPPVRRPPWERVLGGQQVCDVSEQSRNDLSSSHESAETQRLLCALTVPGVCIPLWGPGCLLPERCFSAALPAGAAWSAASSALSVNYPLPCVAATATSTSGQGLHVRRFWPWSPVRGTPHRTPNGQMNGGHPPMCFTTNALTRSHILNGVTAPPRG